LTVAVGAGLDKIANTEVDLYHEYLDWINVMSYDFFGAWDLSQTGHHAGFAWNPAGGDSFTQRNYNTRTALETFLEAGVPPEKIVPGLAFYGRAWKGVGPTNDGLFQSATGVAPGTWDDGSSGATGVDDFTRIEAFVSTGGYVRRWDPIAQAVWAYHPTQFGGHFVSYEDTQSIGVKADYLREHDLGGFMFWEITADRNETLLNAVVDELGGRRALD
jgi:chitinase